MLKRLLILVAVAAMTGACGSSEEGSSDRRNEPAEAEAGGAGTDTEAQASTDAALKEPTAIETVRVAYRETAAEQTAKTSFEMTMTTPSGGPKGSDGPAPMMGMTGGGATDFSGKASVLSMEMSEMGTMEVRQVGDVVYAKMPEEFAAQMPGGKPWLKMNVEEAYGGSGQMQGGAVSDPTRQLEYLRGVSDSVEKIGNQKVRGVQTARYEATIDMKKLVEEQGGEAGEKYEDAIRRTGMEKLPVEIWIDDQNRVRRYVMDMSMSAAQDASGASRSGEMRMRIAAEYYDFGTPVNVQAPPQDQTMDARKMMPARQTPAA